MGIAVALTAALVPVWIVYQVALGIVAQDPTVLWVNAVLLSGLVTAFGLLLLVMFIAATHSVGESVCNALAKRGVELRPPRVAREPRSGDRCVWVRESENSVKLRPQL